MEEYYHCTNVINAINDFVNDYICIDEETGKTLIPIDSLMERLNEVPVESFEPVIRCKECKYWQKDEEGVVEMPICQRHDTKFTGLYDGFIFGAGQDDFCSFAVRKDAE